MGMYKNAEEAREIAVIMAKHHPDRKFAIIENKRKPKSKRAQYRIKSFPEKVALTRRWMLYTDGSCSRITGVVTSNDCEDDRMVWFMNGRFVRLGNLDASENESDNLKKTA